MTSRRSRAPGRPRPDAREARGRDGRHHARRGDAGTDRRGARGAAREGRDAGRDRRLRGGDARARPRRAPGATTSSTRPEPAATVRARSTSPPPPRSSPPPPAPPSRSTATARSPPPRAPPTCSRRSASTSSRSPARIDALDRRARLRLSLCPHPPPGDAPRRARPERARRPDGLQRARPADEPGGRAGAGGRRVRARARADDRGGARPARGAPGVRRARRRRDRRALAGRPEPRVRGTRRAVCSREIDPADFGVPRCAPRSWSAARPRRTRRPSARFSRARRARSARPCS